MKKLISLLIVLTLTVGANAQRATVTKEGNYVQVKTNSNAQDSATSQPNGKTFTDTKGNVYPILVSKNGKEFYWRTSKAGNVYRAYPKVN